MSRRIPIDLVRGGIEAWRARRRATIPETYATRDANLCGNYPPEPGAPGPNCYRDMQGLTAFERALQYHLFGWRPIPVPLHLLLLSTAAAYQVLERSASFERRRLSYSLV